MEKISHIVRGNSRVSSVDTKGSPAVRPGAPSFGRPIGESPHPMDKGETTAARAAAIQRDVNERRAGPDHAVQAMADQFFMSRIRRPEEEEGPSTEPITNHHGPVSTKSVERESEDEMEMVGEAREAAVQPPSGFTPRGSFVDVQA